MIKNADVGLIDKVAINKLKNINQKPRKKQLLNFHVLFVIKTVTSTKRSFFVHIVTTGFIGNVMLHPNRNIQDYQMSQTMPLSMFALYYEREFSDKSNLLDFNGIDLRSQNY